MAGSAPGADFAAIHGSGGFDRDSEYGRGVRRDDLAPPPQKLGLRHLADSGGPVRPVPSAWQRHQQYVNSYIVHYGGARMQQFLRQPAPGVTDADILLAGHRFVRDEAADAQALAEGSYEVRLARKYYDKLLKEYALADFSRYRAGKIGLRWRTEREVVDGKGQFSCANKACAEATGLRSYEVNFAYVEQSVKQNALVKVRVCAPCAYKLFYKKVKAMQRLARRQRRQQRRSDASGSGEGLKGTKRGRRRGSGDAEGALKSRKAGSDVSSRPSRSAGAAGKRSESSSSSGGNSGSSSSGCSSASEEEASGDAGPKWFEDRAGDPNAAHDRINALRQAYEEQAGQAPAATAPAAGGATSSAPPADSARAAASRAWQQGPGSLVPPSADDALNDFFAELFE